MTNQIAIAGSQDGALQIIADPSSFWFYSICIYSNDNLFSKLATIYK